MIQRLAISINWVIGSLAIGFALISGALFSDGGLGTNAEKVSVEKAVSEIENLQKGKRDTGGNRGYVTFSRNPQERTKALGRPTINQIDFRVESFLEDNGAGGKDLVIRAFPSAADLKDTWTKPYIYKRVIPASGTSARSEFRKLSDKPYSLGLF